VRPNPISLPTPAPPHFYLLHCPLVLFLLELELGWFYFIFSSGCSTLSTAGTGEAALFPLILPPPLTKSLQPFLSIQKPARDRSKCTATSNNLSHPLNFTTTTTTTESTEQAGASIIASGAVSTTYSKPPLHSTPLRSGLVLSTERRENSVMWDVKLQA
jgi:hypothetical protein